MNSSSDRDLYRAAARYYRRLEYERAFKLYLKLAEKGDPKVQSIIGFMYLRGKGTPKDMRMAETWFEAAANKGDADAEYYLGRIALMSRDYAAAARWFDNAARRGFSPAMYRLAILHVVGRGVEKSTATAVDLLENAAANGNVWAQVRLARVLIGGHAGLNGMIRGTGILLRVPVNWLRLVCRDTYAEELRR